MSRLPAHVSLGLPSHVRADTAIGSIDKLRESPAEVRDEAGLRKVPLDWDSGELRVAVWVVPGVP